MEYFIKTGAGVRQDCWPKRPTADCASQIGGGISAVANAPRSDAAVGIIIERLVHLNERASDLRDRLTTAMDFVTGQEPPSPLSVAMATDPAVGGAVAEVHARMNRLAELLDGLAEGVRRLERVVG